MPLIWIRGTKEYRCVDFHGACDMRYTAVIAQAGKSLTENRDEIFDCKFFYDREL
jgi:hypothetical protein